MSSGTPPRYTTLGGQAVIEGVMMRSPHFIAVALRKPNQKILVKHERVRSVFEKFPLLKKPVIRGMVTVVESMMIGMKTLSFSAEVASEEEGQGEKLTSWALIGSMAFAFVFGMGLFVALPHFLTALISQKVQDGSNLNSPFFHLVDGIIKMMILLLYVWAISLMKDIYRIFQYHGAEHKSIYDFERNGSLTVESAKKHTTLHPRCGTSFLLFLILISVVVFTGLFPILGFSQLASGNWISHLYAVLIKIVFMFPVAGISYEFIKVCAFRMDSVFFRILIWPGLTLQKITTREPDNDQLEVALVSLRRVLQLEDHFLKQSSEKSDDSLLEGKVEISSLEELGLPGLTVEQFQEA